MNFDYFNLLEEHGVKFSMDENRQALDNIMTERFLHII